MAAAPVPRIAVTPALSAMLAGLARSGQAKARRGAGGGGGGATNALVDGNLPWQLLYADARCTIPVVEAHIGGVGAQDSHIRGLAATHVRSLMAL